MGIDKRARADVVEIYTFSEYVIQQRAVVVYVRPRFRFNTVVKLDDVIYVYIRGDDIDDLQYGRFPRKMHFRTRTFYLYCLKLLEVKMFDAKNCRLKIK